MNLIRSLRAPPSFSLALILPFSPRHYPLRPISCVPFSVIPPPLIPRPDWCFRTSSLIAAVSPWDTTKPICLSRRVRRRTQPAHFRSFAGHRNRALRPRFPPPVLLILLSSRRTSYTTRSKRTAACIDEVSARSETSFSHGGIETSCCATVQL